MNMPIWKTESSFNHDRSRMMQLDARYGNGREALAAAGIDWTVASYQLGNFVGPRKNADRHFVSIRETDGAVVGVNGRRHTTIQNSALADLGDTIRRFRPDMRYVGGGSSLTGETCFLLLEAEEPIFFGDDSDVGYRQIMLATDHAGRYPLFGVGITFRLNCMNQFTMARRQGKRLFSVAHTPSADGNIELAKRTLIEAVKQYDAVDAELERLLATPTALHAAAEGILGGRPTGDNVERKQAAWDARYDLLAAEYSAPWNEAHMGTAFGVVMAAQGVDEHRSRCARGQRDTQRLNRLVKSSYPTMEAALGVFATA